MRQNSENVKRCKNQKPQLIAVQIWNTVCFFSGKDVRNHCVQRMKEAFFKGAYLWLQSYKSINFRFSGEI